MKASIAGPRGKGGDKLEKGKKTNKKTKSVKKEKERKKNMCDRGKRKTSVGQPSSCVTPAGASNIWYRKAWKKSTFESRQQRALCETDV